MAKALGDNCDSCGKDYTFNPQTDCLVIYPTAPRYNHLFAVCPHCLAKVTIFVDIDALVLLYKMKIPMELYDTVHASVQEARLRLDVPLEVQPPREYLIQLHDTLRQFGGNCSPGCGHYRHERNAA